jgi:hypothetical protein
MHTSQYEEHLAHSAPCSSRWDGFDRGDDPNDPNAPKEQGEKIIGRMTNAANQRVVIVEEWDGLKTHHKVMIDDQCVFHEEDDRENAFISARWWMDVAA